MNNAWYSSSFRWFIQFQLFQLFPHYVEIYIYICIYKNIHLVQNVFFVASLLSVNVFSRTTFQMPTEVRSWGRNTSDSLIETKVYNRAANGTELNRSHRHCILMLVGVVLPDEPRVFWDGTQCKKVWGTLFEEEGLWVQQNPLVHKLNLKCFLWII